jgi:hypothetical protein
MRLKLPPGSKIEKMWKKYVAPMFRYDASQRYGGGSYPSYTAA